MKKNDYLLLVATAAYSFLFYKQNAGINFLLFTMVLLLVLLLRNPDLLRHKKWVWAALLTLISAISVFVHSSALSLIANITCLLVLSALSFNVATSALFSFLFSLCSIGSSLVYVVLDSRVRVEVNKEKASGSSYKLIATAIVFLLCILFFAMYQSANPLFSENTKWINFDFISMGWILFTLGGFLMVYGFLYHRPIPSIEAWENGLAIENAQVIENKAIEKRIDTERYAGLLLFIALNGMLLILNSGDIQTLYLHGGLPPNMSHSDFVHNGVGMTILSILLATGLIMYVFRKEFITSKGGTALKIGMFLWIFQNMIMLYSTAMRNRIYVQDYNLTYKRVGVYIWLALAVIGLIILFFKIHQQRSNWYLIRANVSVWFTVLVLSSCLNWDKLITRHNFSNKPLKDIDFYYLFALSDANIPELMAVTKTEEFKNYMHSLEVPSTDTVPHYYRSTFAYLLNQKVYHFVSEYNPDWRSFDIRDQQIRQSIY